MSVDAIIDGLSAEAREAMQTLLRRAYDSGYREGLASAGQPAAPVEWAGKVEQEADDVSGDDGDEDDDNGEEAPAPRPILANAKVGTLHRRIIRTFDLERFDIDVVICRAGDPDRRQLRSTARLGLYRRAEG